MPPFVPTEFRHFPVFAEISYESISLSLSFYPGISGDVARVDDKLVIILQCLPPQIEHRAI